MPFRPWSAPVEGCRHARTPGAEVHRLLGKGCLMALVLVDDGSTDDVESTALRDPVPLRCGCRNSTRRHSRRASSCPRALETAYWDQACVSHNGFRIIFIFPATLLRRVELQNLFAVKHELLRVRCAALDRWGCPTVQGHLFTNASLE